MRMSEESFYKYFQTGRNNGYSSVNKDMAEELFDVCSNKIMNGEPLTDQQEKFMNIFMSDFYPNVLGGELYPYPKYDIKLQDRYRKFAEYLLVTPKGRTVEKIKFLQYFWLTDMCKDFNIRPYIRFKDDEYFEKNPNTMAYHKKEEKTGTPIICYNPVYLEKAVTNDEFFYQLIVNGFHELRHEDQEMQTENAKIDEGQSIIWAKEYLARMVIGNSYYIKNYTNIFHERDARLYSEERLKRVIKSIDPNYEYKTLETRESKYDTNVKHKNMENRDVIAIDFLDIEATKTIGENPQWLNKFRVLKNVFNDDGTKKIFTQIEHEQVMRMQEEIKAHPEDRDKIEKKYARLIYEIAKTDNELFIQKTCLDAYELLKENDETGFKTKMNYIKSLIRKRELSYEVMMKEIDLRLSGLKYKYYSLNKKSNLDIDEYREKLKQQHILNEEIRSTELLRKCMIEYIGSFKDKYDKIKKDEETKKEIEKILGYKIEKHKFVAAPTEIYMVDKSQSELHKEKEEIKTILNNNKVGQEYIDFIEQLYGGYEQELESQNKKRQ